MFCELVCMKVRVLNVYFMNYCKLVRTEIGTDSVENSNSSCGSGKRIATLHSSPAYALIGPLDPA